MKNSKFYSKIKLREEDKGESFVTKNNWWKFVIAIALMILFGPAFPKRHISNYPITGGQYIEQMIILSTLFTGLILIAVWVLIFRPYLNLKKGYSLRGEFRVIQKSNFLGVKKLKLDPGTNHFINVDKQFYKYVDVGDRVFVERRALGDLVKVKKL